MLAASSLGGFLLGAVLAAQLTAAVAAAMADSPGGRLVVTLLVVAAGAIAGQSLGGWLGRQARRRLTWRPARAADAVLGGVVSAVAALLVAWMVATPLAGSGFPELSRAVRESTVVRAVDTVLPEPLRAVYESWRDAVARQGLPDVLGPLTPTRVIDVPAPDPELAADPEVRAATAAVVQVTGLAPGCSRRIEGSGFVYAADRVLTNAHVVAGVPDPVVVVGGVEREATTVYVDAELDVAVLSVSGAGVTPLAFEGEPADTGADVVVTGYPGGGPLYVGAARVRDRGTIAGPDFRDEQTVRREVYALRADVRPGNSGGPLLTTDGTVLGIVFASAVDDPDTGYALTAAAVATAAETGRTASVEVPTGPCV